MVVCPEEALQPKPHIFLRFVWTFVPPAPLFLGASDVWWTRRTHCSVTLHTRGEIVPLHSTSSDSWWLSAEGAFHGGFSLLLIVQASVWTSTGICDGSWCVCVYVCVRSFVRSRGVTIYLLR